MATLTGRVAAFFGPGKPMEIREYPVPDPEPGALVLQTTLANICGSDLHQWRGEFDVEKFGRPYPQILGHEMTGRICRLGAAVTRDSAGEPLREGDRVVFRYFYPCGSCRACLKRVTRACPNARTYLKKSCDHPPHFYGAFGEYYYVRPQAALLRVPEALTDEMIVGVNCALAQVVGGLQLVGLRVGESLVVQGAGGLGVYACAVGKEMGAGLVIAIDGIPERLALAKAFGADILLDLRDLRTPEDRIQRVRELTGGWGADVVAELVGHPRVCTEGLRMLGRTGRYLEIGNINPGLTFDLDPSLLIFGNVAVHGMVYYEAEHLTQAVHLIARTQTKYPWANVVSHKFPLAEVNEAFHAADQGRVTRAAITF